MKSSSLDNIQGKTSSIKKKKTWKFQIFLERLGIEKNERGVIY